MPPRSKTHHFVLLDARLAAYAPRSTQISRRLRTARTDLPSATIAALEHNIVCPRRPWTHSAATQSFDHCNTSPKFCREGRCFRVAFFSMPLPSLRRAPRCRPVWLGGVCGKALYSSDDFSFPSLPRRGAFLLEHQTLLSFEATSREPQLIDDPRLLGIPFSLSGPGTLLSCACASRACRRGHRT